ncbi:MAG: L,D-transpeptidase family protein [Pseudomonadota bacterium]
MKVRFALVILALSLTLPAFAGEPPLIRHTDKSLPDSMSGKERDAHAFREKDAVVKKLFADAGVTFPPRQLLLRGFKAERHLEVWAASAQTGPLTPIATYEICYSSGGDGPKRRQGDGQVPEGFYHLDYFNSRSSFHLSFRVNYPNESDRILGHRGNLGSAIMIHGNCVSIGCLAMSDERIEELWVMARTMDRLKRRVYVHLFPTRDLEGLIEQEPDSKHLAFWKNIKEGYDLFEATKTLPVVRVDAKGTYLFKEGR